MTTKTRALGIIVIILIGAAFVAGFWPEYQRRVTAQTELESLRGRVQGLDDRVRAAQLHTELLDLVDAVEAMNYGQAQSLSSALFDHVREELPRTQDAQLRSAYESILARRDAVTGMLAKGDPAAITPLRESEMALRRLLSGRTASAPSAPGAPSAP